MKGNISPKEFRIDGFHLHSDPLLDGEVITLSFEQTRLLEKYASAHSKRKVFNTMKDTLINAIEILHPRLPDDFFKDFSG